MEKSKKKIDRDQRRISTNKSLQQKSQWKPVAAPIERQIRSMADRIIEDEGFQSVCFSEGAMRLLIDITTQFVTCGSSEIQASVEHNLRHTATEADINIAKSSFAANEGLLPPPSQCDSSVRYANHTEQSKGEITRSSAVVKKKFVALDELRRKKKSNK